MSKSSSEDAPGKEVNDMGCVYRRKNSKNYWIKYYRNGKAYVESSHSRLREVAKMLLRKREGEISAGKIPSIHIEKVTFDDLADDLRVDYEINNRKSLNRLGISIDHLRDSFEGFRIVEINSTRIKSHIQKRQEEGASNATINRELAALKRMLMLAKRSTPPKVENIPFIPLLKENAPRRGFFEHGEFLALRDALPDYLKGFVTFGYKTGWRLSEIANLTWGQVDLNQGIVRLNPGETKNDDGRSVYLDSELREVFERLWEARKKKQRILPWVFLSESGKGKIKWYYRAWRSACKRAGIGTRLFHDLRRTAVRNMVRAGVPERVAMMVSGHKTRSVFERYNIVSEADLKLASQRQEAYLSAQMVAEMVTVGRFEDRKGATAIRNPLILLVGRTGFEPVTNGLKVRCSTVLS